MSAAAEYLDPDDGDIDGPEEVATPAAPRGVFADNYAAVRNIGWTGILWLPGGKKKHPLGGTTGYGGVDMDASQLHELARRRPRGNLAVRAQRGVEVGGHVYDEVFVDVDAYLKDGRTKIGDQTIAEIEARLGVLFPVTWKVSSRGDGISGKYAYLIPAGTKLKSAITDVEMVQWHHRYALIAPSINPESEGSVFRTYADAAPRHGECAGRFVDGMFRPEQATILPPELVEELRDSTGFSDTRELADGEAKAFLDALPTGERCKAVAARLDATIKALGGPGSRYETTLAAVMALLRLGEQGHVDVRMALHELETAYVRAVTGSRDECTAHSEFERMLYNKASGQSRGVSLRPPEVEQRQAADQLHRTSGAL